MKKLFKNQNVIASAAKQSSSRNLDCFVSSAKRSFLAMTTMKAINIILIIATLSVFAFSVSLLTRAQTPVAEPPAADASASAADPQEAQVLGAAQPNQCVAKMKEFMFRRQVEFGEFINTHFRSEKMTSELVATAIERLRQYRAEVRAELNNFFPAGKDPVGVAIAERPACEKAVKENFDITSNLLQQHIVESAYAKKATRLLDKYKAINEKLGNLNFTIAQMYGYFGTLAQKLPCYATKCING